LLYLDVHDDALYLDLKNKVPVTLGSYNPGKPDLWTIAQWKAIIGFSRKQVGEILSGLDRVEEQLSRDYTHVDQLKLVIEGVIVPIDDGHCKVLEWQNGMPCLQGKRQGEQPRIVHTVNGFMRLWEIPYVFNYFGYRKWLESLRQWGIEVIETPTRPSLIMELVAQYQHSQTAPEDHQTFKRVIRPKMDMPTSDPMLLNLMSLHDERGRTFIGMEKANALREGGLGTLGRLSACMDGDIANLPGFGKIMTAKIKRSINGGD